MTEESEQIAGRGQRHSGVLAFVPTVLGSGERTTSLHGTGLSCIAAIYAERRLVRWSNGASPFSG